MTATLTRTELRDLSGRHNRQTIATWLKAQKISYVLDADGWPKVSRDLIERRLGLVAATGAAHHAEPDFDALPKPA